MSIPIEIEQFIRASLRNILKELSPILDSPKHEDYRERLVYLGQQLLQHALSTVVNRSAELPGSSEKDIAEAVERDIIVPHQCDGEIQRGTAYLRSLVAQIRQNQND